MLRAICVGGGAIVERTSSISAALVIDALMTALWLSGTATMRKTSAAI